MNDVSQIQLTPVKEGNTTGFDTQEIKKRLGDDLYNAFSKWFAGKTGAILKGKYCVYPSDWNKWVSLRVNLFKNYA